MNGPKGIPTKSTMGISIKRNIIPNASNIPFNIGPGSMEPGGTFPPVIVESIAVDPGVYLRPLVFGPAGNDEGVPPSEKPNPIIDRPAYPSPYKDLTLL